MSIRKYLYIILLSCLFVLIGCAKEGGNIVVPQGLLNGDSVYIGESLSVLRTLRKIEVDQSGGIFERLPAGSLFQEVGYVVEHETIVAVMFRDINFRYEKKQLLDSLSEICDRAYGDIGMTRKFVQSDGGRFNMRQWCGNGGLCACLIYSTDDEGEIADHAVVSFEVGCQESEWKKWKNVR